MHLPQQHVFAASSQPPTLQDALGQLIATEALGPVYHCDSCSVSKAGKAVTYRNASRRTTISRIPGLLRVHLKRFRWEGVRREKIAAHVAFPLVLDLAPFCEADAAQQAFAAAGVRLGAAGAKEVLMFDLVGVIVHHGRGINSGHYTSYNLNPATNTWMHFNDAKVTACPVDEVLGECAYILVYSNRIAAAYAKTIEAGPEFAAKRARARAV